MPQITPLVHLLPEAIKIRGAAEARASEASDRQQLVAAAVMFERISQHWMKRSLSEASSMSKRRHATIQALAWRRLAVQVTAASRAFSVAAGVHCLPFAQVDE